MRGNSVLIQTTGWSTRAMYEMFYVSRTSFPLLIAGHRGDATMYIPRGGWFLATAREMFERHWRNPELAAAHLAKYEERRAEVEQRYADLSPEALDRLPFDESLRRVRSALAMTWELSALAFYSITFDAAFCEAEIDRLGVHITPERLSTIWDGLTTPSCASFERRHIVSYATLLQQDASPSVCAAACQYFFASYAVVPSIAETEALLAERIAPIISAAGGPAALLHEEEEAANARARALASFRVTLTAPESQLLDYVQTIIALRDARKDELLRATTLVFRVATRAFREVGFDERDVTLVTVDELSRGLDALRSMRDIVERRARDGVTVLVEDDGTTTVEEGTYVETVSALEAPKEEHVNADIREIKGQVGARGVARGRVRIVRSIDAKAADFTSGDVLVTGMTRPEFVPLMSRAAAVVTDEGGITCHAAIISRELGIPCVIGTKHATQLLHDGDLVDVDANAGVVRVIERAS